jgi:hypothetical protein
MGTLDENFAHGGKLTLSGWSRSVQPLAVFSRPDGSVVIAGRGGASVSQPSSEIFIIRALPSGVIDPSFGKGGISRLPFAADPNAESALSLTLEEKLLIAATSPKGVPVLIRLNSDGEPDQTYGEGGVAVIRSNADRPRIAGLATYGDGSARLAGKGSGGALLLAVTPIGLPDPTFGEDGVVTEPRFEPAPTE